MIKRIKAIAIKEIRQLKRDKRMLFVLFVFPLILLTLFGYAISFDVHHIKLGVYDRDKSDDSRAFVNKLTSSEYFDLIKYIYNENDIKHNLDNQDVQAILVIPENFSNDFYANKNVKFQILVDGVNGNSASIIQNYINSEVNSFSSDISTNVLAVSAKKSYMPVRLEPLFWYNPTLNSTFMLIPGLISMILIITAVVSISLSIVREKEKGTIEQILVSPVTSLELLLGKVLPYIVIALFIGSLILFLSYFLFGLVIKGSYLLLLLSTLIFIFASLNLGIWVSSIADSQQVAFQIATLISMLPSMLLSGFVFPLESTPVFIQILSNITPSKFYIIILKNIVLKGTGFSSIWPQLCYLLIFSFFFLTLAVFINKKSKVA